MRVLVVENMPHSKLGQVGVALAEAGADIDLRRPYQGEALPQNASDFDALAVFGGEQSALDDELHPYLPALASLMRSFTEAGKAVLGICLGSQLLARGYGAENLLNRTREFGWHGVTLTAEGRADPVLSAAGDAFRIFEWHSDTFTLPEEAVHLAGNPAVAHQAFRVGRAGYGMQFHFEASTEVVTEWNDTFRHQIVERDEEWLADYETHAAVDGPQADAAGLALARAWVKQIRVDAKTTPLQALAG
ncbi:GMP synthase-like glutamine amidotransferase [Pararhizobium capsulatum DSM 1112]|uniref:GMP synthase-like glutamine amidotransferase n=1 Tax=Pararhizobium capsulatum DSM 1112 TaxID=1121113 RepID=A0ABU0BLR4_9HYPH|nr:type 1 glutamine amidotransferase [Pararhizobium capsulatum]MDQ0318395.1 GMP synthase-like glutamine amidotransferase [Pararhizobium capsulatum DSM 1112]